MMESNRMLGVLAAMTHAGSRCAAANLNEDSRELERALRDVVDYANAALLLLEGRRMKAVDSRWRRLRENEAPQAGDRLTNGRRTLLYRGHKPDYAAFIADGGPDLALADGWRWERRESPANEARS